MRPLTCPSRTASQPARRPSSPCPRPKFRSRLPANFEGQCRANIRRVLASRPADRPSRRRRLRRVGGPVRRRSEVAPTVAERPMTSSISTRDLGSHGTAPASPPPASCGRTTATAAVIAVADTAGSSRCSHRPALLPASPPGEIPVLFLRPIIIRREAADSVVDAVADAVAEAVAAADADAVADPEVDDAAAVDAANAVDDADAEAGPQVVVQRPEAATNYMGDDGEDVGEFPTPQQCWENFFPNQNCQCEDICNSNAVTPRPTPLPTRYPTRVPSRSPTRKVREAGPEFPDNYLVVYTS